MGIVGPPDDYIDEVIGTVVTTRATTTTKTAPLAGTYTTTRATTTFPPVDGGMMPPDDYIVTTTIPDIPSLAGTYTTTKSESTTTSTITTTKTVGTYTTQTTTTTIPPLMGTVTRPTTTTTIPPIMGGFPAPDDYIGDVNLDGKFGIADVVSMQKWLLGSKNVAILNWENADLYPDGKLDVYDICLMREKLISDKYNNKQYNSLEFEITENVENTDFSQYNRNYGLMGGKSYYGMGYSAVKDDDGNEVNPEHYVIYTITAYPDYADGGQYITRIEITDPTVMVNGLTVNSPFEEFEEVFKAMDYETYVSEHSDHVQYNAKNKDGISYTLYVSNNIKKLTIQAEVTNREGIIF